MSAPAKDGLKCDPPEWMGSWAHTAYLQVFKVKLPFNYEVSPGDYVAPPPLLCDCQTFLISPASTLALLLRPFLPSCPCHARLGSCVCCLPFHPQIGREGWERQLNRRVMMRWVNEQTHVPVQWNRIRSRPGN